MKKYVYILSLLAVFAYADNADIDQILEENEESKG